jgi:hypothetical protein
MSTAIDDSKRLQTITFISSLGDFLTYFAVIKVVYEIHGNALNAAFGGIGLGSAACVAAGLLNPFLKRKINTKHLILSAHALSLLCVLVLLALVTNNYLSQVWPFYFILFSQTFFAKVYESSREAHTHGLNEGDSHRAIQVILLEGLFRAQFLGPVAAFVFLKYFTPVLPVALNVVGATLAVLLSCKLSLGLTLDSKLSVFRAFSHLKNDAQILILFLMRTLGFWVPASIFNMIIYESAVSRYRVGVEYAGVIYSVLGLGALLGALFVGRNFGFVSTYLRSMASQHLAASAQLGFAGVIILMFLSKNILWGALCYLLYGVCMGINAISTQALRREYCQKNQLPEIMGLELIVAFVVQFFVSYGVSQYLSSLSNVFFVSLSATALLYVFSAFIFWKFLSSEER